jgi:hypothetical protein
MATVHEQFGGDYDGDLMGSAVLDRGDGSLVV